MPLRCSHPVQLELFCCSSVKPAVKAVLSLATSVPRPRGAAKCFPAWNGSHGVGGWDCVKKICVCLTCSCPWGSCFGPCLEEGCVARLHSGLVLSGHPCVLLSLCVYFTAGLWLGSICSACSDVQCLPCRGLRPDSVSHSFCSGFSRSPVWSHRLTFLVPFSSRELHVAFQGEE